ncbi:MAG TPA: sugar kinase [Roseiflexaceae bacterium]|nr:sugar kinase [Roseiflexaceae bacterium]
MQPDPRPILSIGDLVWDVLSRPDHELLAGGDTLGRITLAPGGSAANTAVWIARAGMPSSFVGKVGEDVMGNLLVADMQREGVQAYAPRGTQDTGVILVLIDPLTGQRSTVINQGADYHLLPDELPVQALQTCRHLHVTAWSLFTDPPRMAVIRAAQIAKAAGATVSLDPASHQVIHEMGVEQFARLTADLPVDMLFPNRDEGAALSGEHEPARIAHALRRRYPGATIVLKLDRDGCYVLADNHEAHYPTTEVEVLDTTGAGDSFDAAFLARYMRDGDLASAARFANRVARWVVARFGARPTVDEAFTKILLQTSMTNDE